MGNVEPAAPGQQELAANRALVFIHGDTHASGGQLFGRDANYAVTYTAGYTAGSLEFGPVKAAALQTMAGIYNSAAFDSNLAGEQLGGAFSGSYAPQGLGALPPGAKAMVEHMRRRY